MNPWSVYWICWMCATFVAFIVPESAALISGRDKDTLSWNIWSFFGDSPGESPLTWTALHVLVGGLLLVVLVWLIGHLVFGLWR